MPTSRRLNVAMSPMIGAAIIMSSSIAPAYWTPAKAQLSVFDPSNYAQNLLTAARTLTQINNQIQSLQNEASMLINQAKNLSRIDFPQLDALRQALSAIDTLMGQATGIGYQWRPAAWRGGSTGCNCQRCWNRDGRRRRRCRRGARPWRGGTGGRPCRHGNGVGRIDGLCTWQGSGHGAFDGRRPRRRSARRRQHGAFACLERRRPQRSCCRRSPGSVECAQ